MVGLSPHRADGAHVLASGKTRSFRCSSYPNRTRFAGLRFGGGRRKRIARFHTFIGSEGVFALFACCVGQIYRNSLFAWCVDTCNESCQLFLILDIALPGNHDSLCLR